MESVAKTSKNATTTTTKKSSATKKEPSKVTNNDKRFVYLVIIEMWEKFMPEKAYSKDDIKRLKEYKDNFYVLTQWLKNDVIYLISLTYSEREQQNAFLEEINSWIKDQMGINVYSKICMSAFSLEKLSNAWKFSRIGRKRLIM